MTTLFVLALIFGVNPIVLWGCTWCAFHFFSATYTPAGMIIFGIIGAIVCIAAIALLGFLLYKKCVTSPIFMVCTIIVLIIMGIIGIANLISYWIDIWQYNQFLNSFNI